MGRRGLMLLTIHISHQISDAEPLGAGAQTEPRK